MAQKKSDEGLAHYRNNNFAEARSYYEHIIAEDSENDYAWFGLGVSALEQGDMETSAMAFSKVASDPESALQSDAIYNLGHVAFNNQKIQESMALFREAISLNPQDQDAKYNFEFLLHQEQQKQDNKNNDATPEPSEEAQRIKKEAEKLVAERKYPEAIQLMEDLLQRDQTAVSYQDYVQRIRDIYTIVAGAQ